MIFALLAGRGSSPRLASSRRAFTAPDGRAWAVEVRLPSASNAMLVFHHPDGATRNRYAWHVTSGPEARDVKARLVPQRVLDALSDADLTRLFRRSMPISSQVPRLEPAVANRGDDQLDIRAAARDGGAA